MAKDKKSNAPVAKIAFRRKGERNEYVAPIWKMTFDNGGVAYNVNPKLESDDYGKMTFQQALKLYAKGDGFLNLHVFETIEPTTKPPEDDEDDDEFP